MDYDGIQLYRQTPPEMKNEKAYIYVLNAYSHSDLVIGCDSISAMISNKNCYIYTTTVTKLPFTSSIELYVHLFR